MKKSCDNCSNKIIPEDGAYPYCELSCRDIVEADKDDPCVNWERMGQ